MQRCTGKNAQYSQLNIAEMHDRDREFTGKWYSVLFADENNNKTDISLTFHSNKQKKYCA